MNRRSRPLTSSASRFLGKPASMSLSVLLGTAACGSLLAAQVMMSSVSVAAPLAPQGTVAQNNGKPPPVVGKPKVYVIPMTGQFGTDVNKEVYEDIIADALKQKPDFVVFHLNCADIPKSTMIKDRAAMEGETSLTDPTEIRDLIKYLREELGSLPQVMWVEDAFGPPCMAALAWGNMYMTNTARLGGLGNMVPNLRRQWTDPDVQAKMIAAWTGIMKGIMEQGGYPYELGDAFMFPDRVLSASFEGRKVIFRGDLDGQWLIDTSDEASVNFRATTAEDVGLSDGNADSFEDLMFILGYREVERIETGEKIHADYVKSWRKALEQASDAAREAQRASEGGELKDLQQAKLNLEKVVTLMKRYKAVEKRLGAQFGLNILALEVEIDRLKEAITGAKKSRTGNSTRGSGGGGGRAPGPGAS